MVSHMNIPSSTKYNAHSLSLFKSNCISESRACKNNLCMKKRCLFSGEEGKEQGATLSLFIEKKKKTTKKNNPPQNHTSGKGK